MTELNQIPACSKPLLSPVRVFNGDCLEIMKSIPDGSIDMVLCDLPYGTTACKWDVVIPFDKLWEQYNRIVKDNGAIVLFADEPFTSRLICSNIENFKYRITWNKDIGGGYLNAKIMPLKQTEDMCVFSKVNNGRYTYNPIMRDKESNRIRPIGRRGPANPSTYGASNGQLSEDYNPKKSYPTNLVKLSSKTAECNSIHRVHPTQKPVALLEYLIKTYTNEGETVLDNTMGSGSTGVACVNTNRKFIGIEMDENYFNIACDRIKNRTRQLDLFRD